MSGRNRVREVRQASGLSQNALASAAGISRQSVSAIEACRAVPGVEIALRLARALETDVESLFGAAETSTRLPAEVATPSTTGRVALAQIAGRWVSYGLERNGLGASADALADSARRASGVTLLRSVSECQQNVVIVGCAPALGLLVDRLNATSGAGRFLWFVKGSTEALRALGSEQAHMAGVHLVDEKTGEANIPDVRRHIRTQDVVLITLARWETGFVVRKGNPNGIRSARDLARSKLRIAVRERGSGARRLLEREVTRAGVSFPSRAASVGVLGHMELAQAVALGAADVGVATRDAALAFGLDFIGITEERYDLVVPSSSLSDPRFVRLFDVMTGAPLRKEFTALGYDLGACGDRVAEIRAA